MSQMTVEQAVEKALQFHLTGQFDWARQYYGFVLHHKPDYLPPRYLMELMERQSGLGEEAIRDAVIANPLEHPAYHTMLGRALGAVGWPEQGLDCLHKALAMDPRNERAHASLRDLLAGTPIDPFPLRPQPTGGAAPRHATAGRPVVLGTATGYPVAEMTAFIRSLRRYYQGDVVLLVNDDPPVRHLLEEYGVTAIIANPGRWAGINIQTARYFHYAEFLEAAGDRYASVLMADVRDLFFQGDPFDHELEGAILYFLEEDTVVLEQCANNALWIKGCFGRAVFERLKGCRISCSGTTLGTVEAVGQYLRLMIATFNALPRIISGGAGHDQAVHNMIAHFGLVAGGTTVENHRLIGTVHHTPADFLRVRDDGVVENRDGTVSKVVHQWDRHPHLAALVKQLYG